MSPIHILTRGHWRRPFGFSAMFMLAAGYWLSMAQAESPNTEAALSWSFEAVSNDSAATGLPVPKFTTQFSSPDFVPGVSGRAWRSDGFSSWVSSPLTLSGESGFTVEAWVALESYPSAYERPVDEQVRASLFQQANESTGFDLFIDAYGRWGFRVSTTSGAVRLDAREVFPLNTWAHVAALYDPVTGSTQLYINGKKAAEKAGKCGLFKPASTDFQIAHSWQRAPLGIFNINGIDGAYDEIRVTSHALSAEQIEADAKAVTPPPASDSLVVPRSRFAGDLQRPTFHALPTANWTNEPHGLIRRGNTWHMFYQRTPNGPFKTLMTWGHMKSEDLIHWTDLPIAIRPELQKDDVGFDMKGIWSGDVVTGPNGWAYAFYTSVNHSPKFYNPGVSLAISDDPALLHWQKAGPLIDRTGVDDFRDPYVWFEGGETKMIVGAALGNCGGVAYYRCDNLASRTCWKKQRRFAPFEKMDFGSEIWEMPVFTKIGGGKYVLEANPIGGKVNKYGNPSTRSVYWIGTWDGDKFTPDSNAAKMLDLLPGHLSPTVARDEKGQLIGIGIVDERRTPDAQLHAGWAHTFGLPRVWRLLPDGETLGQSPLPALTGLRDSEGALAIRVSAKGDQLIGDLGREAELDVQFDPPPAAGRYGVYFAASPDLAEITRLYYDAESHQVVLDKQHSTLSKDGEGPQVLRGAYDELVFGKPRSFHIYIDHSVVDLFINDAAAASFRVYPTRTDSTQFGVSASGDVRATVDGWRLRSAPIR